MNFITDIVLDIIKLEKKVQKNWEKVFQNCKILILSI
jgi:hypothetical protein